MAHGRDAAWAPLDVWLLHLEVHDTQEVIVRGASDSLVLEDCTADDHDVLYLLPDESQPTLSTTQQVGGELAAVRTSNSQPLQELIDARPDLVGQTLTLEYGPRGGERRTFSGVLRPDGVEIDGRVFSLSYGAVYCMKQTGSTRTTANGWSMWRAPSGELLSDIYESIRPAGGSAAGQVA